MMLPADVSHRADLAQEIEALGTNLLTVEPSSGFGGGDGTLPEETVVKIGRIGSVELVADVVTLDAAPLRNDLVSSNETGAINAMAADLDLLGTLKGGVADGAWLTEAIGATPNVVHGAVAADRFGIVAVAEGTQLYLGGEWFTIVGVLDEFPLSPDLDRAVFIGKSAATTAEDVPIEYSIVEVQQRDLTVDHEAIGSIEPLNALVVASSTSGTVIETQRPGATVSVGSINVTVDDQMVVEDAPTLPAERATSAVQVQPGIVVGGLVEVSGVPAGAAVIRP